MAGKSSKLFLDGLRPTWAESSLKALSRNIKTIKKYAVKKSGNKNLRYLLPVKADAYGHAMIRCAKTAIESGADYLGVSSVDEGIALREAGIDAPALLLGAALPYQAGLIAKNKLIASIVDLPFAKALNKAGIELGRRLPVHIKVDTGMGRVGIRLSEAVDFIKRISQMEGLKVEGHFTHFPSADEDIEFSQKQLKTFSEVCDTIKGLGIDAGICHAANSAAVLNVEGACLDMIRPGLISYGYYPDPSLEREIALKPVISLKTKVVFIKDLYAGESVSYGRTYIAKRKTRAATIPIGYDDGIIRAYSNNMEVLVRGVRCPLIGRVTMDQCVIDVSAAEVESSKPVHAGEEVVIIGKQRGSEIKVEEQALRASTIPYEVTCMIGKRVPILFTD